jgi:hypothetical protein
VTGQNIEASGGFNLAVPQVTGEAVAPQTATAT